MLGSMWREPIKGMAKACHSHSPNGLNSLCDSSRAYQEKSLPWLNYIKEQRNHQEISDDDAEMMPIEMLSSI